MCNYAIYALTKTLLHIINRKYLQTEMHVKVYTIATKHIAYFNFFAVVELDKVGLN